MFFFTFVHQPPKLKALVAMDEWRRAAIDQAKFKSWPDIKARSNDTTVRPTGPKPTGKKGAGEASSPTTRSSLTLFFEKDAASTRSSPPSSKHSSQKNSLRRTMRLVGIAVAILASAGIVPAIAVPLIRRSQAHRARALLVQPPTAQLLGEGVPLRIMPLGASITYGYLSSDGNGYRNALEQLIAMGGNPVDMVGSVRSGTMYNNEVEGFPGYRIDQVLPMAQSSVPYYLPNVILLNVGTNDCVQNFNIDARNNNNTMINLPTAMWDTTNIGSRMEVMLEWLYAMSPNVTIILSTLINHRVPSVEARVQDANEQYAEVATYMKAMGRRLVLGDMHSSQGPNLTTMADNTHPNDIGYSLMANVWYQALIDASDLGFLQEPTYEKIPEDEGS